LAYICTRQNALETLPKCNKACNLGSYSNSHVVGIKARGVGFKKYFCSGAPPGSKVPLEWPEGK
jgi:hypothetical protein